MRFFPPTLAATPFLLVYNAPPLGGCREGTRIIACPPPIREFAAIKPSSFPLLYPKPLRPLFVVLRFLAGCCPFFLPHPSGNEKSNSPRSFRSLLDLQDDLSSSNFPHFTRKVDFSPPPPNIMCFCQFSPGRGRALSCCSCDMCSPRPVVFSDSMEPFYP